MFKLWHSKESSQPPVEKKETFFERRADYLIHMRRLSEAACYVAKGLGKEVVKTFSNTSDYYYEHGDFIIEVTFIDRPKVCYKGICVLHAVLSDEFDEIDRSKILDYKIYHADESWESQLFALEESLRRRNQERLGKENARLAEEQNHLPLKDFLRLQQ